MPIFIAALIGGLVQAVGSLVGRVLLAMGIGYVAYTGIGLALDSLKTLVVSHLSAIPGAVVGLLGYMQIGTGISILFSSLVIRMTIAGLSGGTLKKMVVK